MDDNGQHLNGNSILKRIKNICGSIGAPEMRVHDLRHTYSRNSLAAGNKFDQISEALGHSSVDFTKKQYEHFPESLHEKTGLNMDAFEEQRREKKEKSNQKTGLPLKAARSFLGFKKSSKWSIKGSKTK